MVRGGQPVRRNVRCGVVAMVVCTHAVLGIGFTLLAGRIRSDALSGFGGMGGFGLERAGESIGHGHSGHDCDQQHGDEAPEMSKRPSHVPRV